MFVWDFSVHGLFALFVPYAHRSSSSSLSSGWGICRLQILICVQTLHREFGSDLFAMSFFIFVYSDSFLQLHWFRFVGSALFLIFVCS